MTKAATLLRQLTESKYVNSNLPSAAVSDVLILTIEDTISRSYFVKVTPTSTLVDEEFAKLLAQLSYVSNPSVSRGEIRMVIDTNSGINAKDALNKFAQKLESAITRKVIRSDPSKAKADDFALLNKPFYGSKVVKIDGVNKEGLVKVGDVIPFDQVIATFRT